MNEVSERQEEKREKAAADVLAKAVETPDLKALIRKHRGEGSDEGEITNAYRRLLREAREHSSESESRGRSAS
jgi:hypothetical protein